MSVYVSSLTLKGAEPCGTDPLPRFRRETGFCILKPKGEFPPEAAENIGAETRTLPYMMQDRYPEVLSDVTLKTIVMENGFLRAEFTPGYGGKLWSLYDKENKKDLLFANPVLRPRNLAIRNAWTSGGIEWNFGSLGHTVFSCEDVFAAILKDAEGNDFLRIYEFERAKECLWQADFHLPEGSRRLFSHVKLINPNDEDSTTYWWTNIAVPEDGGTRVLCSSQDVIALGSRGSMTFEKLPYLSEMSGDLSYPINATRSFDYFFQPRKDEKTAWESSVNKDGFAFYDRSTAPLLYHKMFCWGNHKGGKRWQDYLSLPGKGDYIELQAGIAQSQVHDKLFPAGGVFEWTQCFGGTVLDPAKVHGVSLEAADEYMGTVMDNIISEADLLEFDRKFKEAAETETSEKDIVHFASGWGALEQKRRKAESEKELPASMCFPECTLGKEQEPWLELLEKSVLTPPDPDDIPVSWMVSPKWMKLLEAGIDRPGGRNWFSLLHYGTMLFEYWPDNVPARVAYGWSEDEKKRYEIRAEEAWKESDMLTPNVWARRDQAHLEMLRDNYGGSNEYYRRVFELDGAKSDFAFCAEYMDDLCDRKEYAEAWALYESMPDNIKEADRVSILSAICGVKLGKLDHAEKILMEPHATIREGETSLTDLWFELCAKKIAKRKGIDTETCGAETLATLIEEAEENCPPPHSIDFRMSYDKKHKYRLSE